MTSFGTECANSTLTENAQSVAGVCRYWSGKNSWHGAGINRRRTQIHPIAPPRLLLSPPQLPPKVPTKGPWWSATMAGPRDHGSTNRATVGRNSTRSESFGRGRMCIGIVTRLDITGRRDAVPSRHSKATKTASPACNSTTTSWRPDPTTQPSRFGMSRRENASVRCVDTLQRLGPCSSTTPS